MRLALGQINPTLGDLPGNAAFCERQAPEAAARGAELIVFPELSLTGYPPRDLVEKSSFIGDSEATWRNSPWRLRICRRADNPVGLQATYRYAGDKATWPSSVCAVTTTSREAASGGAEGGSGGGGGGGGAFFRRLLSTIQGPDRYNVWDRLHIGRAYRIWFPPNIAVPDHRRVKFVFRLRAGAMLHSDRCR